MSEIDIESVIDLLEQAIADKLDTYEKIGTASWKADGELGELLEQVWHSLHHWVSDDDIRERDSEYAEMKRTRLIAYISEIDDLTKNR